MAIGVSGHSVIIKKISMPRMTQEELEESIQWEAEQYIPFDVKDVNIDTQILSPDANDATGQMDVLLVAAKKDMINDYTTVVTEAGLQPGGRRRRRLRGAEHASRPTTTCPTTRRWC